MAVTIFAYIIVCTKFAIIKVIVGVGLELVLALELRLELGADVVAGCANTSDHVLNGTESYSKWCLVRHSPLHYSAAILATFAILPVS